MEFLLGLSIIAFVVVVTTDTVQQRHKNINKNR